MLKFHYALEREKATERWFFCILKYVNLRVLYKF